jgi:hypothetical protein
VIGEAPGARLDLIAQTVTRERVDAEVLKPNRVREPLATFA